MSTSSTTPLARGRPWPEDSGLQVVSGQDYRTASDEKMFILHDNTNEKIPQYPSHNTDYKWDYQSSRGSHPQGYYGTSARSRESSYPEAVYSSAPRRGAYDAERPSSQSPNPPQKKVMGVRRRWFYVGLAAIIAIIAVAVVLGVYFGRGLYRSQAPNEASPPAAQSQAAKSPSITTQTIALPTATLLSDCPSSNMMVRSVAVDGMNYQFRKACGSSLYNPADPTSNVTGAALSLDECISRCASANAGGPLRCDRVCWKNSKATDQTGGAGNCFGYIGANTTDTNEVIGNLSGTTDCDGAYLINAQVSGGDVVSTSTISSSDSVSTSSADGA